MWDNYSIEIEHFGVFVDARAHVTGETLQFVRKDERPDFVVRRGSGSYAGVEFTQAFLNPPDPNREDRPYDWMRDWDVIDSIWQLVDEKSHKRRSDGWRYKLQTILVVTLMDVPVGEIAATLNDVPFEDWASAGFREAWVMGLDPGDLDAYGSDNVQLFCGFPKKWHGFHERWDRYRKPYG